MPGLRSLVFFLVVACWFFTSINSAAVRTLMFDNESANVNNNDGRESERYIVFSESFRTRRCAACSPSICTYESPCAWSIYNQPTREHLYLLKNTCGCPPSLKCVRTNDDLSISAWVHKCRANVSGMDIDLGDTVSSNMSVETTLAVLRSRL